MDVAGLNTRVFTEDNLTDAIIHGATLVSTFTGSAAQARRVAKAMLESGDTLRELEAAAASIAGACDAVVGALSGDSGSGRAPQTESPAGDCSGDVVYSGSECPCCGNNVPDRLVWDDDGEMVGCSDCGCVYDPAAGRVVSIDGDPVCGRPAVALRRQKACLDARGTPCCEEHRLRSDNVYPGKGCTVWTPAPKGATCLCTI